LVRREAVVGAGSPRESALIGGEEFGEVLRFNYAKINSKDPVRCVPEVVRGGCTVMGLTSGTPIQGARSQRRNRRASSVTCAIIAA
jgi:hypothetical protein